MPRLKNSNATLKGAEALTGVRHTTHGKFEHVAQASDGLMAVMQATPNWQSLSVARREAIKMITHKLARIGAGNPSHADHWDDIGGYAFLGKQEAQDTTTATAVKRKYKKRAAAPSATKRKYTRRAPVVGASKKKTAAKKTAKRPRLSVVSQSEAA